MNSIFAAGETVQPVQHFVQPHDMRAPDANSKHGRDLKTMKVELVVARDSEPCAKAIALWRSICQKRGHTLTVLQVEDPEGKRLQTLLGLQALPAVLLESQLVAVGMQSEEQALDLLRSAEKGDPA